MKYLVLGCNGMAGHLISLYLTEQGHDVTGFARSKSKYVNTIIGNAMDIKLLQSVLAERKFDAVINCIGLLNQFAENDKSNAVFLNSYLPHKLAEITDEMNTKVVQMSTDCVFSGKRGNYKEDEPPDGATFYDKSKALGELTDNKNLTFRNSVVGPDIKKEGIGLLNWFMLQSGTIKGYTKTIWTGLTTLELAKIIEKAVDEDASGLFNMVPDHSISKYNLLCLFNKYLRNNKLKIEPVDGIISDKSLIRTNLSFDYQVPDYEKMIYDLSEWMKQHQDIYPHYRGIIK
jgi:dTDP-4-dehydrorhamnose reductase